MDKTTEIMFSEKDVGKNLYRKKTYYTLCIEQDVLAKNKNEADTLLSDAGINYENINKQLAEEKGGVETYMVDANYTDSADTEYVAKVVYDDYDGVENAIENGDVELDTYALESDVVDIETGETTVWNDGESISVDMDNDEGCYNHSLIFGQLLTSSNYDDEEDRYKIQKIELKRRCYDGLKYFETITNLVPPVGVAVRSPF